MSYHRAASAPLPIERRAAGRARADCPARLHTPGGDWTGRLWDLSECGARVQLDNPPVQGAIALLRWGANEAFGRVVWSTEDMCGLAFERPVPRAVVAETIGEPAPPPAAPAATLGNIPAGKRRSRLGLVGGLDVQPG